VVSTVRADAAGARTWLLGASALWALAFWILGLAGLGERIERLPEDPALLQRLPQPPPPDKERLGPLPQYASIGDRPLFSEDRQPRPFFIEAQSDEPQNTFDFVLTSVLLTPRLQLVILHPSDGGNPVRLKVGEAPDSAPGWSLTAINERSAVFAGPEGNTTLELRVFNGIGGEAPTAITTPRTTAADADAMTDATDSAASAANATPSRPAADGKPKSKSAQPPDEKEASEPTAPQTPEAQVEAIRQRIEARRAQLRRDAIKETQANPKPAEE
jgi:general secretion pathway protein N